MARAEDGWDAVDDEETEGWISDLNKTQPEYGFGSYHPGVCNFVLGDGAVRGSPMTIGSFKSLCRNLVTALAL